MGNTKIQAKIKAQNTNAVTLTAYTARVFLYNLFFLNIGILKSLISSDYKLLFSMFLLVTASSVFSFGTVGMVFIPIITKLFGVVSGMVAEDMVPDTYGGCFTPPGMIVFIILILLFFPFHLLVCKCRHMSPR